MRERVRKFWTAEKVDGLKGYKIPDEIYDRNEYVFFLLVSTTISAKKLASKEFNIKCDPDFINTMKKAFG